MSPEATNSIAGGNATGMERETHSDPERVASHMSSTLAGSERILLYVPVALPPAIEFDAFGVMRHLQNASAVRHS